MAEDKTLAVTKLLILYMSMIDNPEEKQIFETIYNNNKDIMYHYAYQILKDNSSAEDAVHDSFLSFARHFEKAANMNSQQIRSYLMITVRNAAFKIYNKHKKEVSTEEIDTNDDFTPDLAVNSEDRDLQHKLFLMIKELDSKYGDVIILKYYCDMRDKDIAAALGITRDNVKIRLHRAKNILKQKLKEGGY